ncbi:xylose isomerase [Amycolatopsis orientalis]|uniref:Xylose isomerase n=1 Tax=Amycolatopsis orientalis TaxID=31958 RepID=A0A193C4X5_AMYOR|nr:sugar phosphate isomerase/epimerase family protein [Amycolatopsis orientalis]ANN19532.1 xylose isomerase [Amycolatopsis orientalis]
MPSEPVLAGLPDDAAHDIDGQISVLTELGWPAIELRTIDKVAIADITDEQFSSVSAALSESGLRVICFASRIGGWTRPITSAFRDDLDELEVLAKRARLLGTRYVRIRSYPNDGLAEYSWRAHAIARVGALADRAERHGVTLLHENSVGWAGTKAERMLDLLDEVGSPALKLLFDTGNGVVHGYDGYDLLTDIVGHVEHVHVKDADPNGYTVPGEGAARLMECVELLKANGYDGAWSLEPRLAVAPHEGGGPTEDAVARFLTAGKAMTGLFR